MPREYGHFRKGQSGNANGRPKGDSAVQQHARERTTDAVDALAVMMLDKRVKVKDRIRAAEAILDRAWGRPGEYKATR